MMEARVVRDFLHTAGGVMVPIEHVYDQIRAFAADAGARKVVLFGSRAKVLYEKVLAVTNTPPRCPR